VFETDADIPRTGTANASSVSSTGPAVTALITQGVETVAASPARPERVVRSFGAEIRRWRSGGIQGTVDAACVAGDLRMW
jgi:hypothetical protein